jgi:hypothetical protein
LLLLCQKRADGEQVHDLAISSSGNSLVLIRDDVVRVVPLTVSNGDKVSWSGSAGDNTFPHGLEGFRPSQVCLLHQGSPEVTIAVSSEEGRQIRLLDLKGRLLAQITFKGPTSNHFIKMHFDSQRRLLLLANSLRGSVFAFKVSSGKQALQALVEWPIPKTLVDFVDALSEEPPSLFCVSTDGIAQLKLSAPLQALEGVAASVQEAPVSESEEEEEEEERERPISTDVSNKIQVDVETAVATDHESLNAPSPRSLPIRLASRRRELVETPSDTDESMRALEDSLLKNMSSMLESTLTAQAEKNAAARATDQAAEIERQEKLLSMVSSTLTKQTSKTLDASIRSESALLSGFIKALMRAQSEGACYRLLAS